MPDGAKTTKQLNLAFASCSAVTLLLFPHLTLQFSGRPRTLISQTEARQQQEKRRLGRPSTRLLLPDCALSILCSLIERGYSFIAIVHLISLIVFTRPARDKSSLPKGHHYTYFTFRIDHDIATEVLDLHEKTKAHLKDVVNTEYSKKH